MASCKWRMVLEVVFSWEPLSSKANSLARDKKDQCKKNQNTSCANDSIILVAELVYTSVEFVSGEDVLSEERLQYELISGNELSAEGTDRGYSIDRRDRTNLAKIRREPEVGNSGNDLFSWIIGLLWRLLRNLSSADDERAKGGRSRGHNGNLEETYWKLFEGCVQRSGSSLGMTPILVTTLLLAVLPHLAASLTCHVCLTGGLDEFAECTNQFQYDCTPYASKQNPGERIFCRTTRERQNSGAYNVTKECISESDHYTKFPNKGYPLDEECDLVDINGEEVAYCVCRHGGCNFNPIAEQFMAFEEKHPELFGDVEDSSHAVPDGPAPLSVPSRGNTNTRFSQPTAFAAPQLTPPAIVPVNDPRFSAPLPPSTEEREVRRQQLPARHREEHPQVPARQPSIPSSGVFTLPRSPPVSQSGFVGTVGTEVAARPQEQGEGMHCVQCGSSGLSSESEDCARPAVIRCAASESFCFTRFINIAAGQHQLEKMCISSDALQAMFGKSGEHCGTLSQGKEHYCACSSSECNRMSFADQKALLSPPPMPDLPTVPPFVARHLHPTPPGPHLAAPELPVVVPPEVNGHKINEDMLKKLGLTPDLPPPPQPRQEPKAELPRPIVPAVVNKPSKHRLRCSSCSQGEMADPTADCAVSAGIDCTTEGEALCLTKQTQIGNAFLMEKRCMDVNEFSTIMPGQPFEDGCATADEGMINYCLCAGDMCNKESLLQQAQGNGVRESVKAAEKPKSRPELPKVAALPPHHKPAVFLDEDGVEAPESRAPDGVTSEEQDLLQRRKQWSHADLNISSLASGLFAIVFVFVAQL